MEKNLIEKNDQKSSASQEEEMDVVMTTPLDNPIVSPDNSTPLVTQSHSETGDVQTHLAATTLPEKCDDEELLEIPLTSQMDKTQPDLTDLKSLPEEDEMEVAMTTPVDNPSVTQTGDVQTQPRAVTLCVDAVCRTEDCDDADSEDSDSDSSSSSSSSSSTSSSSLSPSLPVFEDDDEGFSQPAPIKARDEVLLEELPAVEEVSLILPEEAELQPVGTVSSIVQQLVIIQSLKDTPPLNDNSIIFRSDRLAVGKVFEVFGPVSSPLYILRFNSVDQISNKGLTEGLTLYYAPAIKEFTEYILTQQLRLLKGSDASWKNDEEPPEEALDYSDDEKEQEAKRKVKNGKKKKENGNSDNPAHFPQRQREGVQGFKRPAGPRVRNQNSRNTYPAHTPTYPPPGQANAPPMYLPLPARTLNPLTISPHPASLSTLLHLSLIQLSLLLSGLQTLSRFPVSLLLLLLLPLPHHHHLSDKLGKMCNFRFIWTKP